MHHRTSKLAILESVLQMSLYIFLTSLETVDTTAAIGDNALAHE